MLQLEKNPSGLAGHCFWEPASPAFHQRFHDHPWSQLLNRGNPQVPDRSASTTSLCARKGPAVVSKVRRRNLRFRAGCLRGSDRVPVTSFWHHTNRKTLVNTTNRAPFVADPVDKSFWFVAQMGVSINRATPKSSIYRWDFPWNKPSIWG